MNVVLLQGSDVPHSVLIASVEVTKVLYGVDVFPDELHLGH